MSSSNAERTPERAGARRVRSAKCPVDWEALEDAFENNAPEVHSYLHLTTGEVLRVVDGVADPQMHVRIASDGNYLRIDPVSSREQYRWMERFIPMVDDAELRGKLTQAIDGKGAFRRFKDVLMSYAPERERWFTFRSERLRTFMEAWLARARHQGDRRARMGRRAARAPRARSCPNSDAIDGARSRTSGRARATPRRCAQHLQGARRGARPARPRHGRRLRRVPEGAARGARVRAPPRAHAAGARRRGAPPPSSKKLDDDEDDGVALRGARALAHRARAPLARPAGARSRGAPTAAAAPVRRPRRRALLRPRDGGADAPALRPRAHARVRGAPRGDGRQRRRARRRLPGARRPRRARARRRRADARQPRPRSSSTTRRPTSAPRRREIARVETRLGARADRAAGRAGAGRRGGGRRAARRRPRSTRSCTAGAFAAWYLDRAVTPLLHPSDEQLRDVYRVRGCIGSCCP